jgi:hypothetical protein
MPFSFGIPTPHSTVGPMPIMMYIPHLDGNILVLQHCRTYQSRNTGIFLFCGTHDHNRKFFYFIACQSDLFIVLHSTAFVSTGTDWNENYIQH